MNFCIIFATQSYDEIMTHMERLQLGGIFVLILEGLHENDSKQRGFGFILNICSRTEETQGKP